MPSNFTPNYKLNQWEADDRVLRVDFNADNAKLDAALKAQADGLAAEKKAREAAMKSETDARKALADTVDRMTGLHLLKTGTPATEAVAVYDIDLSDIQWDQWKAVYLFLDVNSSSSVDISSSTSYSQADVANGHSVMIFHPLFDRNLEATAVYRWSVIDFSKHYSEKIHLYLFEGGATEKRVFAGTTYKVYGER